MLTGESVPVDKHPGAALYAGTGVVNGRLVMRVTATGEATALAHIIAAVQRAQTSRANIQRLGDRVSNVFVPLVVALALAAGLWWGLFPESARQVHGGLAPWLWTTHLPNAGLAAAFIIAAAVLIIACPCAMGLATPAAIMASANAAAARGILIRDGVALEKAGQVTAVIFDKTGTLTAGKPEVAGVWQAETGGEYVTALSTRLAAHSTHPLSRAVATAGPGVNPGGAEPAAENTVTVEKWREIRGFGIEATVKVARGESENRNGVARLGSPRWLRESGVDMSAGEPFAAEWSHKAAPSWSGVDQSLIGWFAVRDAVKPGAMKVVQLTARGLRVHLLTGDNPRTAAHIAQHVGIAPVNVFAEVRPEQKRRFTTTRRPGRASRL